MAEESDAVARIARSKALLARLEGGPGAGVAGAGGGMGMGGVSMGGGGMGMGGGGSGADSAAYGGGAYGGGAYGGGGDTYGGGGGGRYDDSGGSYTAGAAGAYVGGGAAKFSGDSYGGGGGGGGGTTGTLDLTSGAPYGRGGGGGMMNGSTMDGSGAAGGYGAAAGGYDSSGGGYVGNGIGMGMGMSNGGGSGGGMNMGMGGSALTFTAPPDRSAAQDVADSGPRRGGSSLGSNFVNFLERKTGIDIDGDGDVGVTDKQQHMQMMMSAPRAQSDHRVYSQAIEQLRALVAHIEPLVARMGLDERPFGHEDYRCFTVRKGRKKTPVFAERHLQVNAGVMGAWDVMMFKSRERMMAGNKPRRTMSIANIRELRIHCINIRTDWDDFKLTACSEDPTAIEELWTFIDASRVERFRERCYPVQRIIEDIQRTCQVSPQGQLLGVDPAFRIDCASLLARGKRVLQLIDRTGGVQGDTEPVFERMVKKTGQHTRKYNDRFIKCDGRNMEIYKGVRGGPEGKPRRTLQLDKIEAVTVDTIKVTEYDTFALRPDENDMSGMRFHDMYLCLNGLFELKQMINAAHGIVPQPGSAGGVAGGQSFGGTGGHFSGPNAGQPLATTTDADAAIGSGAVGAQQEAPAIGEERSSDSDDDGPP